MAASLNGVPGRGVPGLLAPGRPFISAGSNRVNAQSSPSVTAGGGAFGGGGAGSPFNAVPGAGVAGLFVPGRPLIGGSAATALSAPTVAGRVTSSSSVSD